MPSTASIAAPETLKAVVVGKDTSPEATVFTLKFDDETEALVGGDAQFVQTQALTTAGIAVHPYGAVIVPASQNSNNTIALQVECMGETYTTTDYIQMSGATPTEVGSEIDFTKSA